MRKPNLQLVVESAVLEDKRPYMEHIDNGYVDSHTDTYYNDWGGSDYQSDYPSNNSGKKDSGGGCLGEALEGFFKGALIVIVIIALIALLASFS